MPRAAKMMAETKLAMERYFFIGLLCLDFSEDFCLDVERSDPSKMPFYEQVFSACVFSLGFLLKILILTKIQN